MGSSLLHMTTHYAINALRKEFLIGSCNSPNKAIYTIMAGQHTIYRALQLFRIDERSTLHPYGYPLSETFA